ncbi:MAG: fused MFS/spermidine synthase [Bacteroidetes bacterium]|nr:fused MFS/spermidine synthase [Bacteroidota bacterium]
MKQTLTSSNNYLLSQNILLILAFLEGSSVMAIELLSGKMFAPYYGNSLYIWTTVIGITLAGMAAGYYTGGFLVTRFHTRPVVLYFFLAASALVTFLPSLANSIMVGTLEMGYKKGAVISALLFLFPVMCCHGMIPPALIKTATDKEDISGKMTGKIYAVSTTGGIIATLVFGFLIIPDYGLRIPVYFIASILAILPVIFIFKIQPMMAVGTILFLVIFIPIGMKRPKQKAGSFVQILERSDGLLGQAMVVEDKSSAKRTLMVNNISQSFVHIPTQRSQWRYIHRLAMYASNKPAGSQVLVCGLGGGNLVYELNLVNFSIDAVEIDPRMKEIAGKWFFMPPAPGHFTDDARHYLRICGKKYDIIILDMSAGENQPSNVYTVQCFKEIQKILNPEGWLFLHYQNILKGEGRRAIQAIGRTLTESGFMVRMLDTKPNPEVTSEFIFFATMKPVNLETFSYERRNIFADPFNFPKNSGVYMDTIPFGNGLVLTDDAPIMDVLHTPALEGTRGATIKQLIPVFLKEGIDVF